MNWIKNISISKKISLPFFIIILLLIGLGIYIYANSIDVDKKLDSLTNKAVPGLSAIDSMYSRISDSRRVQLFFLAKSDNPTLIANKIIKVENYYREIDALLEKYHFYVDSEKEQTIYLQFKQTWQDYKHEGLKVHRLITDGQTAAAAKQFDYSHKKFTELDSLTTKLYQLNLNNVNQESDMIRAAMKNSLDGTVLCISTLAIMLLGVNWGLVRQITYPVSLIIRLNRAIANGDLSYHIDRNKIANDEFGQLADTSIMMQQHLTQLITSIVRSVSRLQSAVEEVSAVVGQSSAGMAQQQDKVTQIVTAIEQMRTSVADIVTSTETSTQQANQVNLDAQEGSRNISLTLNQIQQASEKIEQAGILASDLEQASTNINLVVDVIRNIAEQTNLLALNAAIEAARAGNNGRGFAVVAAEVRTLAGRTQDSTEEIIAIINRLQHSATVVQQVTQESNELIKTCVNQSQLTGSNIQAIEQQISQINQMSQHIATACHQQNDVTLALDNSINAINISGDEISRGTHHTANACQDLAELSTLLQTEVDKFKLA
ncbi:methyl-accepting chemotaxis protein [Shewanella sp. NFH-SH190041]|uniref:methyl-accepting chemotaxis protein n=1 Tax=Shewanella sp. NFH-SH190041 TaxID=2950245 RepID=UPI0021C337A8|nr:methyl-accepting chemotaxis protein [Shewanella sp. NFH-SH190041]